MKAKLEPMKKVFFFDVHDKDVTPIVYQLMFSQELRGNDLVYDLTYWEEWIHYDGLQNEWEKRIARGPNNCYYDHEAMKKFCENPCSYKEAVQHFYDWLKAKGVNEGDSLYVKIWW